MARILIAEDDEDLRLLLRLVVQRAGHEVEGVGDGVAALRAITRGGYDLVVLDNMMPGMTGLEVLRACKDITGAARPVMPILIFCSQIVVTTLMHWTGIRSVSSANAMSAKQRAHHCTVWIF
mgnify:CR=1 FL=1